jgi:RecA-family ATPase
MPNDKKRQRAERDIGRIIGKIESETTTDEVLSFNTGRQSLESPLLEIPELVNNWIRVGDISLLVGFGGVGKSTIALNLALCLAGGTNFIGYDVAQPERVLYLDLEMGSYEFRTRLNRLLAQCPETAQDNFYWACLQGFTMRYKENEAKLKNTLAVVKPKLLIIDNHASFHGGDPNSEAEMMINVILPFREIMPEFELGILYLMHTPWGERDRPRGTAAIFDAASTCVAVVKPQANVRQLTWTKRRSVRSDMGAKEIEVGYSTENYTVYRDIGQAISEILREIDFPTKRATVAKHLAEALSTTSRQAYRRIQNLVDAGILVEDKHGQIDKPL